MTSDGIQSLLRMACKKGLEPTERRRVRIEHQVRLTLIRPDSQRLLISKDKLDGERSNRTMRTEWKILDGVVKNADGQQHVI